MKKRIVFFHMLNDISGSPRILSLVIKGLVSRGYRAELYTSASESGFLNGIEGVKYHYVNYRLTRYKALNILRFILAQFRYFFGVLRYSGSANTDIYINTMLPVGALAGAAIIHKRIICHIHEEPDRDSLFHRFSLLLIRRYAFRIILVSDYQYNKMFIDKNRKVLIYNALSEEFVERALKHKPVFSSHVNVLMACSLRKYKGIDVFVQVAAKLPSISFTLLLNSSRKEAESYFSHIDPPENLNIIAGSEDISRYYEKTGLVLNLSQPDFFIETFGLTVLEAMTYGIPVIVPESGGVAGLVEEGVNGFKVDTSKPDMVIDKIIAIFSDEEKYYKLSESAREKSKLFSYATMIDHIIAVTG